VKCLGLGGPVAASPLVGYRESVLKAFKTFIALLCLILSVAVQGQEQAPLQADVTVRVNDNMHRPVPFSAELAGGEAALTGTVSNLPGGDTAFVALRFDYRINADIALDEIISKIVVTIEDLDGNLFSMARVNPNTVHLNPNRVPLYYSVTLYLPETARHRYVARVRVFGNYE
jgi:hypothetical protein